MHGCSTPLACWFDAHPAASVVIVVVCALVLFIEGVWMYRVLRHTWQANVKDWHRQAEEEREWKMQRHRLKRMILQAEEWERDASQLKDVVEMVELLRKAHRIMVHEQFLVIVAWIPVMMLAVLTTFVHVTWLVWNESMNCFVAASVVDA